jgi:DNA-binding CsgD family transcriptional regulator/tetratricopeptide (TPR) repeat protein
VSRLPGGLVPTVRQVDDGRVPDIATGPSMPDLGRPGLPMVGRREELAALVRALGLAGTAGHGAAGGCALLTGDAGAGKSRLLVELAGVARAAGWRVLAGHCLDFGDGALPYLPFSEIFGRLADQDPELAGQILAGHPAVARLMPGHRQLVAQGFPGGPADSEAPIARGEVYAAVDGALAAVARQVPLLIVVEDVHWADRSTLEVLGFLLARRHDVPVALVVSYRTDDLHRRHPLRPVAAQWSRLPGVQRLSLEPLPDEEVRAMASGLRAQPFTEPELRGIVRLAEGNAFFVEEMATATALGCCRLTSDLAEILLVRLDQLDDLTRAVVRAAAVVGRQVPHLMLSAVCRMEPAQLDAALRDAVDNHVLVLAGSDGYAFRHALLLEAVYDDLLPGERVRLHGACVAALLAGEVPGTAAELARHALASHQLPIALRASVQAGDEAMSVGGPEEAGRHYETALDLLGGVGVEVARTGADPGSGTGDGNGAGDGADAAGRDVDRVALVLAAASAASAGGHPDRALTLVADLLGDLPDDTPAPSRAGVLLALADLVLLSDSPLDPLTLTNQALALVPADPPSGLRARLAGTHARANLRHQRLEEAGRWAEESVGLARRLGLASVAADSATTLAGLSQDGAGLDDAVAALEAGRRAARRARDSAAELRNLHDLARLYHRAGRLPAARAAFEQAAARAAEHGRPWAPYAIESRVHGAVTAYLLGDWDDALALTRGPGEPPALAAAMLRAARLAVDAGRGTGSARSELVLLDQAWDQDALVPLLSAPVIDLLGDAGDLDAAAAWHQRVTESVTSAWQRETFQAQVRMAALLIGQLATEADRPGGARGAELVAWGRDLAGIAEVAARWVHEPGGRPGPEGAAWVARVGAEQARLRWLAGIDPPDHEEMIARWGVTIGAFADFGHVFELARSRARLAAVMRAAGRWDEAEVLAGQAFGTAARLRAEPLLGELGGSGRRLAAGTARARAPGRRGGPGLTGREREVLALVATGLSNGAIGSRLFISTKTASVHVSNILAKLDATSRTEAAAIAHRRGLLGGPDGGPGGGPA